MRLFINEYIKILAYTLIGLVFMYASYYLIANIYHYQEIRKNYYKDISMMDSFKNINTNIEKIDENININIDNYSGKYKGEDIIRLKNSLSNCESNLNNDYLAVLKKKKKIDILDVETLRSVVVNNVVNGCLIQNMYYLTYDNSQNSFLNNEAKLIQNNIDTINNQLDFINRNILNNSSLYFDTKAVNSSTYDKVGDNFNNLLDLYSQSTNLIVDISDKFNQEVKNNG